MRVLSGRNAHVILPFALQAISEEGERRDSRNGAVLKFPEPTAIHYFKPTERVVFHPERDCNPFFHLMESLWMLGGRNDVAYLTQFNARMAEFSDDGRTFHGAYGYRWRNHFWDIERGEEGGDPNLDQIQVIIRQLRNNSDDRRCVLQMWDAESDLGRSGKDFPCNTQAVFGVNNGKLDMSVFNRSNDLVWGALGANAVHFSILQEYIAAMVGVEVGEYHQISHNMHLYTAQHSGLIESLGYSDAKHELSPYEFASGQRRLAKVYPLVNHTMFWDSDLEHFLANPHGQFADPFFADVAQPMFIAYEIFKGNKTEDRYDLTLDYLRKNMAECDWKIACEEWVARRKYKYFRAKDDGVQYK